MESVSTVFLIDLALDLSGDWVKLARALGLEDQVERIRRDNEKNVREQAYRLLLTWKQSHGTCATLELLYKALRKPTVSRVDLAEKYCENYNQGSSKAVSTGAADALDVTDSPFIPSESRLPVQNPDGEQVSTGAADALDVSYSPLIPLESRPPLQNPVWEQENRPRVSSSPADLSQALEHVSIQETEGLSEKQKISLASRSKENKCLWEQEVQSLDGFQDLLTSVLKINLDPKRELGGDYRSIAGAFGKDMKYIWYLENKSSPIEELLKECRPTLGLLCKLLSYKEVNRGDVAKEITAWVKKKGCCCSKCDLSLR